MLRIHGKDMGSDHLNFCNITVRTGGSTLPVIVRVGCGYGTGPGARLPSVATPVAGAAPAVRGPPGGGSGVPSGRSAAPGACPARGVAPVSYTHLRGHETKANTVCRLLLEKK